MNIAEVGPDLKQVISTESAEAFEEKYPNLLVCFDLGAIYGVIANYFQIEGLPEDVRKNFGIPMLLKATEEAFLTLLKRGALDGFVKVDPLPPPAREELDRMAGVSPREVDPAIEAKSAKTSAIDEVAVDYFTLDSRQFKAKWLTGTPERRAIYESAISLGKIK